MRSHGRSGLPGSARRPPLKPASAMPIMPRDDAALETVAGFFGDAGFRFHPARAAALHVGRFEVFLRERFLRLEQFEHGFGELRAGGPGFVHARAGEDVGAAAAFADARVAVADEMRFAAPAGFAERLRAPRAELAALEVAPEIRMQHPVLEVAVGRAHRAVEPRRHEDAERRDAVGMHVEESKNLRLGITERVQHRAGFERRVFGQIHHELHAHGPVARVMASRQAEMLVELLADRADRAVADDGERGVDVHAGHEAVGGLALLVHALVEQAHADDFVVFDQRLRHRRAGPDLDRAGALHLRADPLHELAHRKHHAAVLVQKGRRPRQVQRVVLERQRPLERANARVRQPAALPSAGSRQRDRAGKALFLRRPARPSGCRPFRCPENSRATLAPA